MSDDDTKMSEGEFKRLLYPLLGGKLTKDSTHQIRLIYKYPIDNIQHVHGFIDALQDKLNESNSGVVDLYGLDENLHSGEFFIRCSTGSDPKVVFNRIQPLLLETYFFVNGEARIFFTDSNNLFQREIHSINKTDEPVITENEPELPIPEGFEGTGKNGCLLATLVLLLLTILLINTF